MDKPKDDWRQKEVTWSKAEKRFVPLVDPSATKRTAFELAQCTDKARNLTAPKNGRTGVLVLSDDDTFAASVAKQLQRHKAAPWSAVVASPFGSACHSDHARSSKGGFNGSVDGGVPCVFGAQAAWLALASSHAAIVHLNNDVSSPPHLESAFMRYAVMYAELPPSRIFASRSKKPRSCEASAAEPWLGRPPTRLDRYQDGNWMCHAVVFGGTGGSVSRGSRVHGGGGKRHGAQ